MTVPGNPDHRGDNAASRNYGSQDWGGGQSAPHPGGGANYAGPGGQGWQAGEPLSANRIEAKGFFAALFDFSFRTFITISFAKVVYGILIVVAAAWWLIPALLMFTESPGLGFLSLLFGWIPGLLMIIVYRIFLEVTVALVRTSQNTAATRDEIELLRRDLHSRS